MSKYAIPIKYRFKLDMIFCVRVLDCNIGYDINVMIYNSKYCPLISQYKILVLGDVIFMITYDLYGQDMAVQH